MGQEWGAGVKGRGLGSGETGAGKAWGPEGQGCPGGGGGDERPAQGQEGIDVFQTPETYAFTNLIIFPKQKVENIFLKTK